MATPLEVSPWRWAKILRPTAVAGHAAIARAPDLNHKSSRTGRTKATEESHGRAGMRRDATLGKSGVKVSAIGLGCVHAGIYARATTRLDRRVHHRSIAASFFSIAPSYATAKREIVGRALRAARDRSCWQPSSATRPRASPAARLCASGLRGEPEASRRETIDPIKHRSIRRGDRGQVCPRPIREAGKFAHRPVRSDPDTFRRPTRFTDRRGADRISVIYSANQETRAMTRS